MIKPAPKMRGAEHPRCGIEQHRAPTLSREVRIKLPRCRPAGQHRGSPVGAGRARELLARRHDVTDAVLACYSGAWFDDELRDEAAWVSLLEEHAFVEVGETGQLRRPAAAEHEDA